MATVGSFTIDRSKKDDRIQVSHKGYTSNDLRAGTLEEQREIGGVKTHLWLRERIPQPYDLRIHATYVGTPSLCCTALSVYMTGRVRSNFLAQLARPFWVGSMLAGAAVGHAVHQQYHMQRWHWKGVNDV